MLTVISLIGVLVFGGFITLYIIASNKKADKDNTELLKEFENLIGDENYNELTNSFKDKGLANMFKELQKKDVFKAQKVDSTDSIKALKLKIEDINQTIAKHLTMMNNVNDIQNVQQIQKFIFNRIKDLVNSSKLETYSPEIGTMYDYTFHKKIKSIEGGNHDEIKMVVSPGYKDENGVVILKAEVITWEG